MMGLNLKKIANINTVLVVWVGGRRLDGRRLDGHRLDGRRLDGRRLDGRRTDGTSHWSVSPVLLGPQTRTQEEEEKGT